MKVKRNIEYSFTANSNTYHVRDCVYVKTAFLERFGEITKIGVEDFEIKVCGNDERLITIKYANLKTICFDNI